MTQTKRSTTNTVTMRLDAEFALSELRIGLTEGGISPFYERIARKLEGCLGLPVFNYFVNSNHHRCRSEDDLKLSEDEMQNVLNMVLYLAFYFRNFEVIILALLAGAEINAQIFLDKKNIKGIHNCSIEDRLTVKDAMNSVNFCNGNSAAFGIFKRFRFSEEGSSEEEHFKRTERMIRLFALNKVEFNFENSDGHNLLLHAGGNGYSYSLERLLVYGEDS